jgi:hypothetical protein
VGEGEGVLPDSPAGTRVRAGLGSEEEEEPGFFFFLQVFGWAGEGEGWGVSVGEVAGREELEGEGDAGESGPATKVATAGPGKV